MSEVKIKKIEIKVGKKTINLSLEQAKELKGALDDLFQQPVTWYYPYTTTPWTYTTTDVSCGTLNPEIYDTATINLAN